MTDEETKNNEELNPTETATAETGEEEEKEFVFVEDPAFEVEYKGECAYEVKVSIPPANERKLSEETLEELRKKIELPGFRRGRAPKKLVERKLGKALRSDVESQLAAAAFKKLLEDQKLSPLGQPDIEGLEAAAERKEDEPLKFTLKFEVKPKVELAKYRGVEVERPVVSITDADVDEVIGNIQSRYAVFETAPETTAAKPGDQVVVDFRGTIDGEEFPGGSATDYPYILGSERFFDEFEQALNGAEAGTNKTCEVTFPEDYSTAALRGKTATFAITVKEIKRKVIPELNDEFAQQTGYGSLEEMRRKVRERLIEDTQRRGNRIAKSRALETIVEASTFEFPKSLVQNLAREEFERRMRELRDERRPVAEVEQMEAEIREQARQSAIATLKNWVTLNEIAEAEGIEVTDEDFEKEATALARRTGASPDMAARYLGDQDRRGSYEMQILHEKVLDDLLAHATIKDKELTDEETKDEAEVEAKEEE